MNNKKEYIYKTHSVTGERFTTCLYDIMLLCANIFLLIELIYNFSWIALLVLILFFVYFLNQTIYFISLIKNTIDYVVVFYNDYLVLKYKTNLYYVDYNNITDMTYKHSYSLIHSGVWVYLEITCDLKKPVYIMFSIISEYCGFRLNNLKKITNLNFKLHFAKILKCPKDVKKREKNNII